MSSFSILFMKEEDYPQLYRAADNLSIRYQNIHYGLLFSYLLTLILGGIVSICGNCVIMDSISLGLFILSAALYAISKICNPVDLWYNGRAVAESVKSMTWKWMMMADPYQNMNNESQKFLSDLHYLLQQNKSLFEHYQHDEDCHFYTISEKMRAIRSANISDKLSYYNENRVSEQLTWYKKKSKKLHKYYVVCSWIVAFCYIIIILFMIASVANQNIQFPTELISTIVTALISWMEAKKYNELSCAYSLAVNDISIICEHKLKGEISEEEVSEYVTNSENAFSREHTQWIARKQ